MRAASIATEGRQFSPTPLVPHCNPKKSPRGAKSGEVGTYGADWPLMNREIDKIEALV